jgi:hypothetical protein
MPVANIAEVGFASVPDERPSEWTMDAMWTWKDLELG